jgi:hypothetical protein
MWGMLLETRLARVEQALQGGDSNGALQRAFLQTLTDMELETLEHVVLARDADEPLTAVQAAVLTDFARGWQMFSQGRKASRCKPRIRHR